MATKSDFIVKSGLKVSTDATVTGNVTANSFSGNGVNLTSVNSSTVGGNTASDLRTYADQKSDNAYSNAVSYVDGKSYVNTSQLSTNLANYALLSGASFSGNVTANNANTLYNLNVGGNLTVEGNLTVTGNVTTIGANNLSIVDNFIYLNSNNTTQNEDIGIAGNYNDGTYAHTGIFRDATDGYWKVFDGYTPEPDSSVNIDTSNNTFNIAGFWANNIRLGNTTVYSTANSTVFSGTANNTSFVGTVSAANVVSNAQLSSNLSNYAALAGASFTGNVGIGNTTPADKLSVNGTTYLGANVTLNAALIANGGAGTAGQVLTTNGTATYWSTVTSGAGVNVDSTYAWTNVHTFAANVGIGTISPTTDLEVYDTTSSNSVVFPLRVKAKIGNTSGASGVGIDFVANWSLTSVDFTLGQIAGREYGGYKGGLAFLVNNTGATGYPATAMTEAVRIDSSGNVGIGTASPGYKLQVNGSFAATTKSFVIDHPTKPGMKLRYGSLEGPENGVYVRGESTSKVIELPDYWEGLVDEDTITVTLTPIGKKQSLYVKEIKDNAIVIGGNWKPHFYYTVYAERRDVEKLVVEF